MPLSRVQVGLAMLAPLLAAAGCAGPGTPCTTCDAGAPDRQAGDFPVSEASASSDGKSEAPMLGNAPDTRPSATRDVPAGEAQQPTPIPDGGWTLVDDFDQGEAYGWLALGGQPVSEYSSKWAVLINETGAVLSQGALDNTWHIAYPTRTLASDHVVEARLRVVDFVAEAPSYMAALFGRYDPETDSGYFLALRADGSVIIRRRDHGVCASWGGGTAWGIRPGVWYTARLEVNGKSITAFIDGREVYAVLDDSPLHGRHLGLGTIGVTLEADYVLALDL
jgi:hypothetical protein